MIKAIVYTSNAGTTRKYAELLGSKTGLPVYDLKAAKGSLEKSSEIIYMGWLMASSVKGYKTAKKHYNIRALCGVGMGETGSQLPELRKRNSLPEELTLFTLRGGFDIKKLHGIYKFMMKTMQRTAGKALANKQDRTPDEDIMLDMMQNGRDMVSLESLTAVLVWFEGLKDSER